MALSLTLCQDIRIALGLSPGIRVSPDQDAECFLGRGSLLGGVDDQGEIGVAGQLEGLVGQFELADQRMPNDAARMVIVERWENRQAFDEHFTTPHLRHAQRVLDRILARPLTLRTLVEAP